MNVVIINENKKDYLDLLLLADEQEDQIDKYLDRGTLFALYDDDLKSTCVVTDEGNGTFEIQSLATYPQFQKQGYGRHLINYVCDYFSGKGQSILVGTGDSPPHLRFYENSGFVISHRLKNYFVEHYAEPIIEGGVQIKDKIYLKRALILNIIETERLILRPLTLADAETAFKWTGDPNVAEYVSWLPHHSIGDTIDWLNEIEWKLGWDTAPCDNYIWGFVLKKNGELFGSGGLIWEDNWKLYQVGYNIMKTHWNRGYTTEAMKAVLKFAAVNFGIKKVAGGHAKENLASAKVIEKLGFVYNRDDITPHIDGKRFFDSREYFLELGKAE